ncbi:MAG: NUDIX domain-containing protein [Nanoarchaeota archaeon]
MSKTKKAVCAGGIVLNHEGLVLVVNSRGNSWSLPKGHLEKGESTLEAAMREIMEESGVTGLDLQGYLGSYERYKIGADGRKDRSRRKEIHLYLFRTEQQRLYPLDRHTQDARWVPREQVPKLLTYKKDRKYFKQVMCKL